MGTTSAIAAKFFPGENPINSYNRLTKLRLAGFTDIIALDQRVMKYIWILTSKSYAKVQGGLPKLLQDGFRSENSMHDFFVSAVHLGDWLVSNPPGVEFFSEQELRRLDPDHFPAWVPRKIDHRSDGYWRIPYKGGLVTVALEVELTPKRDRDYVVLAHEYKNHPQISRVVWVARTQGMAGHIYRIFTTELGEDAGKHDFILLEDFQEKSWQARIIFGTESGKTLGRILGSQSAFESGELGNGCVPIKNPFLDTRRYVRESTFSAEAPKSLNCD